MSNPMAMVDQSGGRRAPTDPIAIAGARPKGDVSSSIGAFSLGGSSCRTFGRSLQGRQIDYNSIELKYSRPTKQEARELSVPAEEVGRMLAESVVEYFGGKTCYDAMPPSTQVVVVDDNLPLKAAFISAIENKVPFGTLWDPEKKEYVGMMTVTDYIKVLLRTRSSGESIAQLEETPITVWRGMGREAGEPPNRFVYCSPDDSVLTALKAMRKHHVKRLPLLGPGKEVLHVLNYSGLLQLLLQKYAEQVAEADDEWLRLFEYSVKDLGVGQYGENLPVVRLETPVHEVLSMLIDHQRHCLPIVDADNRVLDVFTRNDVMRIEQQGTYDIEMHLGLAIEDRVRTAVACYSPDDTLASVAEHLGKSGVRSLICVDEANRVCGHLCVTDIFSWLASCHEDMG